MSSSDNPSKRFLDVKEVASLGGSNKLTPDVLPAARDVSPEE